VRVPRGELRVQAAAARLQVTIDKRLGKETPEWIKDLAK
jgi:hypothetical protein